MKFFDRTLVLFFLSIFFSCKTDFKTEDRNSNQNSNLKFTQKKELRNSVLKYNLFEAGHPKTLNLGKFRYNSIVFDVFSIFKIIQLASSKKGQSYLVFVSESNDYREFDMEMPNNLPIAIENNNLLFYLADSDSLCSCKPIFTDSMLCIDCINECFFYSDNKVYSLPTNK